MAIRKLNWKLYTSNDRVETIERFKALILDTDSILSHYTNYSDVAFSMVVQIEGDYIAQFYNSVKEFTNFINDYILEEEIILKSKEYWLLINVSFSAGKGQMQQVVPEVPG